MNDTDPKFLGDNHIGQWNRIERWYKKVKEVEGNVYQYQHVDIKEQEDYLYFFFLNILNLGDWLKNSFGDSDFHTLLHGNNGPECLKICRDFSTNFKHYDNSNNAKLFEYTYFVSRSAQSGVPGAIHTWWVQTGGGKVDAYDLARDCFEYTKQYMKDKEYI